VSTVARMRAMPGALVLLCSCYAPPPVDAAFDTADTPPAAPTPVTKVEPQPADPVPSSPRIVCDMSKFSFTQESGCVNDGWVEFCAEKAGAPVVTQLRALSPDVQIVEGHIGRAACNEATDYLVSHPVREADCTQRYGALTDSAWNTLCALSQVPETKHFVPGFAE